MTPKQLESLAETRTLQLLKRFSCQTATELEQIASREYATAHFDITTVKLVVETLLQACIDAGMAPKAVASLGLEAINAYGKPALLSSRMRELKQWRDNRHIHGSPRPGWLKAKG